MGLISVVVITYNEERHIARCLASVKQVADEIIVLDSFSDDRTAEIAEEHGAKVIRQAFKGYISQKNSAMAFARHEYILSLDADEALSEELVQSILAVKQDLGFKAYKMNRKAFYCGAFITHGSWYPEPKVRLFNRRAMQWGGMDPHDRIIVPQSVPVRKLKGDLLHYICDSVEQHKRRSENFSTIASQSLYKAGKTVNSFKIIASPAWFFLSDYVFRGGFLSGWRGWKIATIQMKYHFEKYRKLYNLMKRS